MKVFKGHVTRKNFSCKLQRNKRCIVSCVNNCPCDTPFSQLAILMQQNIALQVARKVELSSILLTLGDKLLRVTCPAHEMNVLDMRCKLQEKLPRVTWPYSVLVGYFVSSISDFLFNACARTWRKTSSRSARVCFEICQLNLANSVSCLCLSYNCPLLLSFM